MEISFEHLIAESPVLSEPMKQALIEAAPEMTDETKQKIADGLVATEANAAASLDKMMVAVALDTIDTPSDSPKSEEEA